MGWRWQRHKWKSFEEGHSTCWPKRKPFGADARQTCLAEKKRIARQKKDMQMMPQATVDKAAKRTQKKGLHRKQKVTSQPLTKGWRHQQGCGGKDLFIYFFYFGLTDSQGCSSNSVVSPAKKGQVPRRVAEGRATGRELRADGKDINPEKG